MFFQKFNPMTEEEVIKKVSAAPMAESARSRVDPGGDSPCRDLANRRFCLKFNGEFAPAQLDYDFGDDCTLAVAENGEHYYNVPYNAMPLRRGVILFTHIVPGTSRGWHIIADTETSLVTAFETWFGVTTPVGGNLAGTRPPDCYRDIPREVQRHYHFGYIDSGQGAPEKLHTTTNRIEGRGLHWRFDDGGECLTFFPSVVCSTAVWFGEPYEDLTITYPSDYIRIDDELFIFAKWGVEYGGEMWLEVVDMSEMRAIGVKFGFNADDVFEYKMHGAILTLTGDAAHLEQIARHGDKAPPMAMLKNAKGARYAYRPRDIDVPMSREEAYEAAKTRRIYDFSVPNNMAGNCLPFNYSLSGKRLGLVYDHVETPYAWSAKNTPDQLPLAYEYEFIDGETLKWRVPENGRQAQAAGSQTPESACRSSSFACRLSSCGWRTEKYVCFEPAKDIYFFSHMLTGEPDFACVAQAVDFSTGLATCVYARIGSWTSEWEAGATCLFGAALGEGVAPAPFGRRHGFTNDLVGKCYAWSYSEQANSIHVYSSPKSYSWTIFQADNSGGASWSSPGFFIKLRDDAYLFQWVEETCNGIQSVVCFNPLIMHDSGFSYGVNRHGGLQLSVMGAYARKLGAFDIMKYFDKSRL